MKTRIRELWRMHDATMLFTLTLWLCVSPFVLLFTVPFFGWQTGLMAVGIALPVALGLCWTLCQFPKIPGEVK